MTTTFALTENEYHAAMVLVGECLAAMGGKRPADLEHDEHTWVSADTLIGAGWKRQEAAGTFSALADKGVITIDCDGEGNAAMTTEAWQQLDKCWGADGKLATTRKAKAKPAKAAKAAKAPAPAAPKPEAAGRRSQYAGKRIYALVKENPRKAGAAGWHSMELIMKAGAQGIAYEDYAAAPVAGGNHLRWDLDREHIEIK